ncbi:TPA: DUF3950 domain-containing protein, partial [Escherichia coli]
SAWVIEACRRRLTTDN